MTVEERFERLEHVVAGMAEERRKDREESHALWRETQRQINEITIRLAETNLAIANFVDATDKRFSRIERLADERAKELDERISKLVSAIGVITTKLPPEAK